MRKLDYWSGMDWTEHSFSAQFACTGAAAGTSRLVVGVPHGNAEIVKSLVSSLEPPYFLLYVLHTPRGEGKPGRYQSPGLSREQLYEFISEFGPFLSGDARFDLWARSPSENATVVWDRHNLLFAYGPLDRYTAVLHSLGFVQGTAPKVPEPHAHHYRHELDEDARKLLSVFEWSWSPLRPEDEQLTGDEN